MDVVTSRLQHLEVDDTCGAWRDTGQPLIGRGLDK
jgi:hypothetical protein